tara:strand:- start:1306 stop:1500 length:195 start_codon:yes stop_codon:yes gene_type:complete
MSLNSNSRQKLQNQYKNLIHQYLKNGNTIQKIPTKKINTNTFKKQYYLQTQSKNTAIFKKSYST